MTLKGSFSPTGDKLFSHRYLLLSILAEGDGIVSGLSDCDDVKTAINIYKQLGGYIEEKSGKYYIKGMVGKLNNNKYLINCENSATLMRLLTGLLAGIEGEYILDGDELLKSRPLGRLIDPLRKFGAGLETEKLGRIPLKLKGSGKLNGIEYKIADSNIYLKSALILAALSAEGTTILEEEDFTCNHTELLANIFKAKIKISKFKLEIQKKQLVVPENFSIPGDSLAAAYFLISAAFMPNSDVTATNVLLAGERIAYLNILARMGAFVAVKALKDFPDLIGNINVKYKKNLKAVLVQPEESRIIIEELPILALAASFAEGETVFMGIRELHNKKTDRVETLVRQFRLLGINIKTEENNLIIKGTKTHSTFSLLNSYGDPAMAMLLKLALTVIDPTTIDQDNVSGIQSISISYPHFLKDLKLLLKS